VRDLDEIAGWSRMSDAQKQAVLDRIAERRASLSAAAGFAGRNAAGSK